MGAAVRTAGEGFITPTVRVRLEHEGVPVFGPGPCELLRRVSEEGSLHRAAASMRMAYSKAWRIVRVAEEHLGFEILDRTVGGIAGGGSVLTPEGAELLRRFVSLQDDLRDTLARLFAERFGDMWPASALDREPGEEVGSARSRAAKTAAETAAAPPSADIGSAAESAHATAPSGETPNPART